VQGRAVWDYIIRDGVGRKDLWLNAGLVDHLTWHLTGSGGHSMLGAHLYILVVLAIAGIVVVSRSPECGARMRAAGLACVMFGAWLVPTINPQKQSFLAVQFQFLLILGAVVSIRLLRRQRVETQWWQYATVIVATIIALALVRLPPQWGEGGQPYVAARNAVLTDVYELLRRNVPRPPARVFITTVGFVNRDSLQYLALKQGFPSPFVVGPNALNDGMDFYEREIAAADLVVASEPGNSQVAVKPLSHQLQEQTLHLVRARDEFRLIGSVPTPGEGKSYYLFARKD
jgi:hypothetical protein